jgi:PPP family 3-phenylpropionic acid transporter
VTREKGSASAGKVRDRTVLSLSILSAVVFLPLGLHLPYFPVYLASRGLTEAEIAVVVGTPIFLRVLVIPIVAAIADTRGIAATLAACTLVMLAGYCGLGLAEGFVAIFLGGVLAATAMGMLPSLTDALTLSQIRRADVVGIRPIAYSRIRVWTPIGVLGVMILSGPIVEAYPGTRLVLVLAAMALMPALAALFAAATIGGVQPSSHRDRRPLADPAHRRLAIIVIIAAALIQSSHAQVYTFGTLHWKASGYSPDFIGIAWAIGVAAETIFFLVTARFPDLERHAPAFLVLGAIGAAMRWLAMSTDPGPEALVALQAMHGLSFAATYLGSVLIVGSLAGPGHRARMQGRLAAASALGLGLSTLVSGRLASHLDETAYLVMALLAGTGLCLAILGGLLERRLAPIAAHSAAGRCSEPSS